MPRKVKLFWGPWAMMMALSVLFILVGSFVPMVAGAQKAAQVTTTAPASMAYIDVTKVPIVFAADKPAVASQPVKADDVQGVTSTLRNAMRTSNWRLAVIAGLLLAVLLLRKVGGWFLPAKAAAWVNSDRGGATLALAAGVLTVVVNGLVAGGPFDPQLLIDGVLAACTAAGGFSVAKKLAAPSDKSPPVQS